MTLSKVPRSRPANRLHVHDFIDNNIRKVWGEQGVRDRWDKFIDNFIELRTTTQFTSIQRYTKRP